MNKKTQIEEMAIIMADCRTTCDECFKQLEAVITLPITNRADHCQAYMFAKRAFEAGYRKIPKDAVVLTKEEFENFGKDCKNCPYALDWYKETLHKETAREILSAMLRWKNNLITALGYTDAVSFDCLVEETAQRYGVEEDE